MAEGKAGRTALAAKMKGPPPKTDGSAEIEPRADELAEAPPDDLMGTVPPIPEGGGSGEMVTIPADVFRMLVEGMVQAQGPSTVSDELPPAPEGGGVPPELMAMLQRGR